MIYSRNRTFHRIAYSKLSLWAIQQLERLAFYIVSVTIVSNLYLMQRLALISPSKQFVWIIELWQCNSGILLAKKGRHFSVLYKNTDYDFFVI